MAAVRTTRWLTGLRWFHPDGTVEYEQHYQVGRRVS
jgi:hypothetical protein